MWEYRILDLTGLVDTELTQSASDDDLIRWVESKLNEAGADGWEIYAQIINDDEFTFFMKRYTA